MRMTSTREGTTQSSKMPPRFLRAAKKEKNGEKGRGCVARRRRKKRGLSLSSFPKGGKERRRQTERKEVHLLEKGGGETRCHVAFRYLLPLELPLFLLSFFVRLYFPAECCLFLFASFATANPQM